MAYRLAPASPWPPEHPGSWRPLPKRLIGMSIASGLRACQMRFVLNAYSDMAKASQGDACTGLGPGWRSPSRIGSSITNPMGSIPTGRLLRCARNDTLGGVVPAAQCLPERSRGVPEALRMAARFEKGPGLPQGRIGDPSAQDASGRQGGCASPIAPADLPPCASPSAAEGSLRRCAWQRGSKRDRASLKDVSGIPRHRTPREDRGVCLPLHRRTYPCASPSAAEGSLRHCTWQRGSKRDQASLKDVSGIPRHRTPREDRGVCLPACTGGPTSLVPPGAQPMGTHDAAQRRL